MNELDALVLLRARIYAEGFTDDDDLLRFADDLVSKLYNEPSPSSDNPLQIHRQQR